MESSFLNLVRGNRLTSMMGLELFTGEPPKYGVGYTYVEVPVAKLVDLEGNTLEKGLRNQHIAVIPECTVMARGDYKILVEPNRAFWQYGTVQGMYYIQPGDDTQAPGFYVILRRDLDLTGIDWAVRLYLRS